MGELHPDTLAAFNAPRKMVFGAFEFMLPSGPVRILDGSYQMVINGNLFTGRDPNWGTMSSVKGLADTMGNQAPRVTVGVIPANDLALANMANPALQGSVATIMTGAINMVTGLLIGEPYICFTGELDVPTITWDMDGGMRSVEFTLGSDADRLFMTEEGRTLSPEFHRRVWPDEAGCDLITGVSVPVPWGQALDTTAVTTRSNSPLYIQTGNRT